MSGRHLGLFDTPPSREEVRFSVAIVGVLFAALLVILPMHENRVGAANAFIPVIDAVMCTGELIIGALLFAQASVFRSRALVVLSAGYVSSALLIVAHGLTFPGAFTETGLLGARVNTTAWIFIIRRLVLPVAIILYVLLKHADLASKTQGERKSLRILDGALAAIGLSVLTLILVTSGHDLLPPLFLDNRQNIYSNMAIANSVTIIATVAAIVMLFRQTKSVLDMWLLVALGGWLIEALLNLPLHARFTLGWYCLFSMMLISTLTVMLALIAESGRLYSRLALAVEIQEREFENRLMSMDAVAAVIAHEVGQPLAAVTLNTKAGIDWLGRNPPDPERALLSLQFTMEASRRALDVIKSVRATFGPGSRATSEFNFNDLVRETALLLDRDLIAQKISLRLALDESLPPIHANRIQLQRVIVNLLTNAIDSLAATPRRRKRDILISSTPSHDRCVLLEICDSGVSISPEAMAQIFEPFFTIKTNGSGLGLPLSRTIVEAHGGRLWASTSADLGATFHLHLPSHPAARP